jgi:hypothetical protein
MWDGFVIGCWMLGRQKDRILQPGNTGSLNDVESMAQSVRPPRWYDFPCHAEVRSVPRLRCANGADCQALATPKRRRWLDRPTGYLPIKCHRERPGSVQCSGTTALGASQIRGEASTFLMSAPRPWIACIAHLYQKMTTIDTGHGTPATGRS